MTAPESVPAPAPTPSAWQIVPLSTRISMFSRLLAIQGSWNYEILLGNGIGFCVEPALRRLPGGRRGAPYREALARQSRYFNAHPYLASVAVGALARAELDREKPERIERFRTASCGPLGSLGDRLVWAGWLPFCSLLALAAFGLGVGAAGVLLLFLGLYNAGHLSLRAWGLHVGLERGIRVAGALGNPVLQHGPAHIARAAAFVAGVALPLSVNQVIGPGRALLGGVLFAALAGALVLVRLHGRAEGWRTALGILSVFALISVLT